MLDPCCKYSDYLEVITVAASANDNYFLLLVTCRRRVGHIFAYKAWWYWFVVFGQSSPWVTEHLIMGPWIGWKTICCLFLIADRLPKLAFVSQIWAQLVVLTTKLCWRPHWTFSEMPAEGDVGDLPTNCALMRSPCCLLMFAVTNSSQILCLITHRHISKDPSCCSGNTFIDEQGCGTL